MRKGVCVCGCVCGHARLMTRTSTRAVLPCDRQDSCLINGVERERESAKREVEHRLNRQK